MVLETLEGPAADSNLWAEIGNEQRSRLHSDSLVSIKVSLPPLLPIADHKGTFVSRRAANIALRCRKPWSARATGGILTTHVTREEANKVFKASTCAHKCRIMQQWFGGFMLSGWTCTAAPLCRGDHIMWFMLVEWIMETLTFLLHPIKQITGQ